MKREFEELRRNMTKSGSEYAILYIDEVDALAPQRGGANNHEESRRMLSELLQQVDGFGTQKGIILIASTNTPEVIDTAFLSRMEIAVEVPLPNLDGLAAILSLHFSKASVRAKRNIVASNVDFRKIAERLIGCSGRDIESIVNMTLRLKVQEDLKRDPKLNPFLPFITEEDIFKGIESSGKFNRNQPETQRVKTIRRIGFVMDDK